MRYPAGTALHHYLAISGISIPELARKCRISREHMRKIAGGARPDFATAMKIEQITCGLVHRGSWTPPYRLPPPSKEERNVYHPRLPGLAYNRA